MNNKLNLIVVGNKLVDENHSKLIDSFDYVLRVSRMNNFGSTGVKIDGLFLEPNYPFKFIYNGGEFKTNFYKAHKIFMCPFWHLRFKEWKEYLTEDQYKNTELIDDIKISELLGFDKLTSTIRIIAHLLNTSSWKDRYNIHFTAIDVENRTTFVDEHPYWNYHKGGGKIESAYLLEQINKNNLIRINL